MTGETIAEKTRKHSAGTTRGYFFIGVWHVKSEVNIGTLFRSAWCFGASGIFTIGRRYKRQASDTVASQRHIPCFHYDAIDQLVKNLPHGCPLIGVELDDRAEAVGVFSHPERGCYLLGAEDHGLSEDIRASCHSMLMIPGLRRCLNVSVAGSIVMFDRMRQRQGKECT